MVQEMMREKTHNGGRMNAMDEEIADLVELIRVNRDRIESFEAAISAAKGRLRELLEERGESWSDASGYARLVAEGLRHYYDSGALDEMIISDPLRYGWLKDYRKESQIAGRVQVK